MAIITIMVFLVLLEDFSHMLAFAFFMTKFDYFPIIIVMVNYFHLISS